MILQQLGGGGVKKYKNVADVIYGWPPVLYNPEFQLRFTVSYDIVDEDKDPTPSPGASHGTAMAGIVAAVANNSACSAGVAFDANIGMVRLSGGGAGDGFKVTDIMRLERFLIYLINYL